MWPGERPPAGPGGSSVGPLGAHSLARRASHRRAGKPAIPDTLTLTPSASLSGRPERCA